MNMVTLIINLLQYTIFANFTSHKVIIYLVSIYNANFYISYNNKKKIEFPNSQCHTYV